MSAGRAVDVLHAGLTGGLGSGKSTVAALFAELGAVVLDADQISRELTGPSSEAAREVEAALGPGLLGPDGSLDRPATARRVFGDEPARRRLEAILHPRILARRADLLREIRSREGGEAVVVTEAALIFEADTRREFDAVVLVTAGLEQRLERLARRGMSRGEARSRISAQWDDARKVPLADFVIDNSGELAQTRRQVASVWEALKGRGGHD